MEQNFKKLKTIYSALILIYVIISAVVFLVKTKMNFADIGDLTSPLIRIFTIAILASILIGFLLYELMARKTKTIPIENDQVTNEHFGKFRNAMIIFAGFIEFSGILTNFMVLFFYNINHSYIYWIIMILVIYVVFFPTKNRFERDFFHRIN